MEQAKKSRKKKDIASLALALASTSAPQIKKTLTTAPGPTRTHSAQVVHELVVVIVIIVIVEHAHIHVHAQRTRSRHRPRHPWAHSLPRQPLSSVRSLSLPPGPHTFAKKFFDVLFIYFVKLRARRIRIASFGSLSLAWKLCRKALALSRARSLLWWRALPFAKRIQSVMKSKSNSYQLQRPLCCQRAAFPSCRAALELCPKAVKISANCKK